MCSSTHTYVYPAAYVRVGKWCLIEGNLAENTTVSDEFAVAKKKYMLFLFFFFFFRCEM